MDPLEKTRKETRRKMAEEASVASRRQAEHESIVARLATLHPYRIELNNEAQAFLAKFATMMIEESIAPRPCVYPKRYPLWLPFSGRFDLYIGERQSFKAWPLVGKRGTSSYAVTEQGELVSTGRYEPLDMRYGEKYGHYSLACQRSRHIPSLSSALWLSTYIHPLAIHDYNARHLHPRLSWQPTEAGRPDLEGPVGMDSILFGEIEVFSQSDYGGSYSIAPTHFTLCDIVTDTVELNIRVKDHPSFGQK